MTTLPSTSPASPSMLPVIEVRGSTSRRRHVVVAAVAILPILTVLVATFTSTFESATWTIATQVGSPVAMAATWGVIAVRSWPPLARVGRHVVATLVGVSWSAAAAIVVLAGAAEPSWDLWGVGVVGAAGVIGLWLAWWAGGLRYGAVGPIVVPRAAPSSATERTAWSGASVRVSNLVMWLAVAAMLCVGIVMSLPTRTTQAWLVVGVIAVVVTAIPLAVRVTVDRRGLRVRALVLGIPLVRVPLDRVASAAAGVVEEGDWGNGATVADRELVSIVHRSGPALIVSRTDGSMVVVSAPRPDEAAAVLETLRARAARTHG